MIDDWKIGELVGPLADGNEREARRLINQVGGCLNLDIVNPQEAVPPALVTALLKKHCFVARGANIARLIAERSRR